MTRLDRPVVRKTATALDGSFGPDSDKAIVVRLVPGDGKEIPDLLELWPLRTRRVERIAVMDVYRFAIRARVNRQLLERARERKEAKARRRESARLDRAERRLRQPLAM